MTTTTISVPGSVYYDALDPLCSGMAAEIGLPTPTTQKRGKGTSFVYAGISFEQAEEVADYIGGRGESLLGDPVDDRYDPCEKATRDCYRAAVKAAAKIRVQIKREKAMREAIEAPVR
jgi:hypothetical protein